MPSKLGKSWRDSLSAALFGAVGLLSLTAPAQATLQISSGRLGSLNTANSVDTIYFTNVGQATPLPSGNALFFAQGTGPLNFGSNFATDPSQGNMSQAMEIIVAPLNAITAAPSGQTNYLFLQFYTGTTGNGYLPIAGYSAGGTNAICSGNTQCGAFGIAGSYNYGVNYGAPAGIGLYVYPGDICAALASQGLTQSFCIANVITPVSGTPATVHFKAVVLPGTSPPGATPADSPADTYLNFQTDINETNCPANLGTPLTSAVRPGDGELLVDTAQFGLIPSPSASALPTTSGSVLPSGDAPAVSLLVLATPSPGVPDISSAGYLNNRPQATLSMNAQVQAVQNFTNTTQTTPVPYSVDFLIEDATGLVLNGTGCTQIPFETYQIFGFLNKSRCFIATAAFRDADVAPVRMLRNFRDQVLLPRGLGRAFVRSYYKYSPQAAVWLMENPEFRYPVLLALIPVEFVAWAALHSAVVYSLALAALGLLLYALFCRIGPNAKSEVTG